MKTNEDIFSVLNCTAVAFLITEVDIAFTFLDVSKASRVWENVCRNRKRARLAYDIAQNILAKVRLDEAQRRIVEAKLDVLKTRLEGVGQSRR